MKPKSAETVSVDLEIFRRGRVSWNDQIQVGERVLSTAEIIFRVEPLLTRERLDRLKAVVAGRTRHLVAAIENPYDLGNISAVMRSAEAFGLLEVGLITPLDAKFKAANRVAKGRKSGLIFQFSKVQKRPWSPGAGEV